MPQILSPLGEIKMPCLSTRHCRTAIFGLAGIRRISLAPRSLATKIIDAPEDRTPTRQSEQIREEAFERSSYGGIEAKHVLTLMLRLIQ
jgi:hypothetical protein